MCSLSRKLWRWRENGEFQWSNPTWTMFRVSVIFISPGKRHRFFLRSAKFVVTEQQNSYMRTNGNKQCGILISVWVRSKTPRNVLHLCDYIRYSRICFLPCSGGLRYCRIDFPKHRPSSDREDHRIPRSEFCFILNQKINIKLKYYP